MKKVSFIPSPFGVKWLNIIGTQGSVINKKDVMVKQCVFSTLTYIVFGVVWAL